MMNTNNNQETPERSEIPYLRLVKQLGLQRGQGKPQYNVVPSGRPYFVAHIPQEGMEFEYLRIKFNDIIQELTYREAQAWCRGIGKSRSTFLMRKYHLRKPPLEEVILTCAWYDDGKPIERKNHHDVASFEHLIKGINMLNARGNSTLGSSTT